MADFESVRRLPYSLEAEQAILGAIILDSTKIEEIGGLTSDDFYLEQHKQIFVAMLDMYNKSRAIDTVTLINSLTKLGNYTEGDAAKYIKLLADLASSATNISVYADIVRDKSVLRKLISASSEITEAAFAEVGEVSEIVDAAEQKIFDVASDKYNVNFTHIRDIVGRVYEDVKYQSENPNEINGVKTVFDSLDSKLVSLGKGDLVIVGGRPGIGKTSFAMNIAANVAKTSKKQVAIFSFEMSAEQLVSRLISSEAHIDGYTMRTGKLAKDDWQKLAQACSALAGTDILIDDTTNITTTNIKSKLRRLNNLGLVVIDYLQLMHSDRYKDNKVLEVADITRNLKLIAKDLGVPIILVSQLSRGIKGKEEKRPNLQDLRDSGAIEQDADIVILLYRKDYFTQDDDKKEEPEQRENKEIEIAECIIAKNRHGDTGTVNFAWFGKFFKFLAEDSSRAGKSE